MSFIFCIIALSEVSYFESKDDETRPLSFGAWGGENNPYIDSLDFSLVRKGTCVIDFHDSYEPFI